MNKKPINHAQSNHFDKALDGLLIVGGKSLSQIERMVCNTPFYVYDKTAIAAQIASLKNSLPGKIKLHYAIKANPLPALVNSIQPLVSGFDVASRKEMLVAIQSGMPAEEISFAGPGKSDADLAAAISAGVNLHCESFSEYHRTVKIGKSLNTRPSIAFRVNPAFELKASGMKMAGGAKPFGIDEEELFEQLPKLNYNEFTMAGFHIFAGSQNLNPNAIIEAHCKIFELANKLIELTPKKINYVNIGGGLGIPYFPGESHLELDNIAANLTQLLAEHESKHNDIDIVMELGRYLVGEAGLYVCKVVDIKQSRGTKYLVTDGGLHHHLANSGNFGQVIRKNYPVAIGNKYLTDEPTELVNIVGPLCTPLDILADKVELPKAEIGDYVIVFQSGAYGATASPQSFLSQPSLTEILL